MGVLGIPSPHSPVRGLVLPRTGRPVQPLGFLHRVTSKMVRLFWIRGPEDQRERAFHRTLAALRQCGIAGLHTYGGLRAAFHISLHDAGTIVLLVLTQAWPSRPRHASLGALLVFRRPGDFQPSNSTVQSPLPPPVGPAQAKLIPGRLSHTISAMVSTS